MLPFLGIINGLLVPTLIVPPYFFALLAQETVVYQLVLYGTLFLLLLLFYMEGKSWRNWFHENMQLIGITSVSAFVMTITIIVLIMQGNKRSFYHEKVSRMQSGMITFMAEVVENRDDNTGGHIRRTAAYVECIAKELKRQGGIRHTF